jgi:hypothetical protein
MFGKNHTGAWKSSTEGYGHSCWTCGAERVDAGWVCNGCHTWTCEECVYGCFTFICVCQQCEIQYCNICAKDDKCACGRKGKLILAYAEDCSEDGLFRSNGYWFRYSDFTDVELREIGVDPAGR